MWSTVREVSIGTNLYDGSDATQSMYIPSHGGGQPFAATLENEKAGPRARRAARAAAAVVVVVVVVRLGGRSGERR